MSTGYGDNPPETPKVPTKKVLGPGGPHEHLDYGPIAADLEGKRVGEIPSYAQGKSLAVHVGGTGEPPTMSPSGHLDRAQIVKGHADKTGQK